MKKAKQYAEQLSQAKDKKKELSKIYFEFVAEIDELKKLRNVRSDAGVKSIILELSDKWASFARRVEWVKEDGFISLLKHQIPVVGNLGI